jgi:hypothetical protein
MPTRKVTLTAEQKLWFWHPQKFDYAFGAIPPVECGGAMVEVGEITLQKLRSFSDSTNTMLTIDAPLFGSVTILNGRVLAKGADYVDPAKIGHSTGFPSFDNVVAEASRFWIQYESGIRKRVGRHEMAKLIEEFDPARTMQQNA